MPFLPRLARRRLVVLLVGGALLATGACAGGRSQPKPVATLASSAPAAAAFEVIREAWGESGETDPAALRALLERFLAQYPTDGLVPFARVLLALVCMTQGDFATADAHLAQTQRLRPGTVDDLRTIARARRLRLRGK